MRFRLVYRGPLASNGRPEQKHCIRAAFHHQLKKLWQQKPLNELTFLLDRDHEVCVVKDIGGFSFAPLVSSIQGWNTVAELSILLLRPCEPGALINHGGDLDNRLKTLFDGLTLPKIDQLPPGWQKEFPTDGPFFVLLEDDALVTALSIKTDRLLKSDADDNYVELIIKVTINVTRTSFKNVGIAG